MDRIQLAVGQAQAIARLYSDAAPRTAALFMAALPVAGVLRQSRWSGPTTFVLIPALRTSILPQQRTTFPEERAATFMCPGRIYVNSAGLGLPYGAAQSRDVGLNTWLVELGELEGDYGPFLSALRRVRRDGARPLTITRLR
jgi:hypothetical protein